MIVLSASGLGKSYGTDVILENISFHINAGDKVGIVGVNGAGKTTLMNMLTGELTPSTGSFFVAKDMTLGYLKQRDQFSSDKTVLEEVSGIFSGLDETEKEIGTLNHEIARLAEEVSKLRGVDDSKADELEDNQNRIWNRLNSLQEEFERKGGYTYKSEVLGVMTSMGFGEESQKMLTGDLSGGERTRLALACLLLRKPDILLLDEPTNHLDIGTLKWLEQYLRNYKGTIILISHDRYFLDSIATHIFDVENHGLTMYKGNYSEYAEKKRTAREIALRAYSKQQEEIKRQEDLIRRYKQRGTEKLAKRAASREKRLEHVERLEKPMGENASIKINFNQRFQSGYDILLGEDISFGYAGKGGLFRDVNFDIKRGEKVCIIGDNGTGKTTLLKIMMGDLSPNTGYVKVGHNVEIGYYDQGQLLLNESQMVIDEIHNEHRLMTDGEVRNALGRFLFRGDAVFNQVSSLSGGEKARLSLLKLMMSGANLLVLDEPTNHLDIQSKEVFEDALMEYPGTVIIVSHDRYFLNKVPDRIFELTEDGLREFLGKYDYYLEKKASLESGKAHVKGFLGAEEGSKNQDAINNENWIEGEKEAASYSINRNVDGSNDSSSDKPRLSSREERELKKKEDAAARKKEREMNSLMEKIEELESLIEKTEAEMCLPENALDHEKLRTLSQEVEDWKSELNSSYDRWMTLAEE